MSKTNKQVMTIILGGGAGTRLFPLTAKRSKPAVPLGGKYRLIDIPVSNCLNSGLTRIFVATQFNSASLNRHLKNTYQFDAFNEGFVDVMAAEQTPDNKNWFQGTADAVRQSMHRLTDYDYEYVLILSGDQLYQMDYEEFINQHIAKNADLSIATIPVTDRDAPGFGIMKVNSQGEIDSFIEKPAPEQLPNWQSEVSESQRQKGQVYLASMGIYLFNKAKMKQLFDENPDKDDFGKSIIPSAIEGDHKVISYAFEGYWTDIGSVRSFFEASMDLTENVPKFNLFHTDLHIYTRARMLAPAKIMDTKCYKALIAEGCVINASEVTRSVIGIRSRIDSGSVIRNVITMGMASYEELTAVESHDFIPQGIGRNCHIENAIIDIGVRIGSNVQIKGSTELENVHTDLYSIVDGIIVIPKGASIPSGSKIGAAV